MKLVVEVIDAHNLMPKDGQGSVNPFVEVDFQNQLSKTKTIPKNLNPVWNHKLVFEFDQTQKLLCRKFIQVSVFHEKRPVLGRIFLGKIRIPFDNIVEKGDEVYQEFKLEKSWFLSSVKGEIGLKIYISHESETKSTFLAQKAFPAFESFDISDISSETEVSAESVSSKNTSSDSKSLDLSIKTSKTECPVVDNKSAESIPETEIPATNSVTKGCLIDKNPSLTCDASIEKDQYLDKLQVFNQTNLLFEKKSKGETSTMHSIRTRARTPNPNAENYGQQPRYQNAENYGHQARQSNAEKYGHQAHNPNGENYGHQARSPNAENYGHPARNLNAEHYNQNARGHNTENIGHQARNPNTENYSPTDTKVGMGERWKNTGEFGGMGWIGGGERFTSTYDLVEQMHYLYVRVVKAKDLPPSSITGGCDPYVEVKLGNYKGRTKHFEKRQNPEWNQVFAFSKERIQSSTLEVFVKDKEMIGRDDYLGRIIFDINEIPTRVPPDSPLAPQWYRLDDRKGEKKVRGELMVAVWLGTQADESFSDSCHADSSFISGEGILNIRSKVYMSPKLWYLRVNIIEAQDIIPNDRTRTPELFFKAQIGNQVLRTRISPTRTTNPIWDEDLIFVVAEPFEDQLVITIEDKIHISKDEVLGKVTLPLGSFEKRLDHRPINSKWVNLIKHGFGILEAETRKDLGFSGRVHLRVCLEGGYHVLDESTMYISDTRPTSRQLWKQPIGVLEVGILSGAGFLPMKMKEGRGSVDAYCVAKYGQKWVRTRTVLDSLSPKWNEQYTWEVYDPCTVITLGVFDNCHLSVGQATGARDSRIGKVRIRLSNLEAHKLYTNSFPLLVLHPNGVKKMGDLNLAIRFTTLSLPNMVYIYGHSLLPKMHYLHPFTINQLDNLRYQAMNIVSIRLSRAEPPLRKETIEYMLDVDSHLWSMRKSKANFFRIMSVLSGLISVSKWFEDVCGWKNVVTSVLVHVLFLILVVYPELVLPTLFLYMFFIGCWNYRSRSRFLPHMDTKISWAEYVDSDELDEEFDTFPTSKQHDVVRMRYDRLRSVAGRIQTVVGDIATQGERFQSLLSWRDPRATGLFIMFCLCAAILLYTVPFRLVALVSGFYYLRHPKFRSKVPSVPGNFFKRLSARTDSLL